MWHGSVSERHVREASKLPQRHCSLHMRLGFGRGDEGRFATPSRRKMKNGPSAYLRPESSADHECNHWNDLRIGSTQVGWCWRLMKLMSAAEDADVVQCLRRSLGSKE